MKGTLRWLLAGGLILVVGVELVARYVLGLGTPPLSQPHPRIEYLFQPNQDVSRFGNRVLINAYGMRSADFPELKPAEELRVMIFGDSVLNGGNLTDHDALATTLLSQRLAETEGRPVVVGNISAGSWGPGNWLAYAKDYGFFDADVVVLLISSHDVADNPTFVSLNPNTHPQQKPVSALVEGMTRYLPRYLPSLGEPVQSDSEAPADDADSQAAVRQGLADLRAFLELAQQEVPRVLVVQHPERQELTTRKAQPGFAMIRALAVDLGVEVISAFPAMDAALADGENPYRDNIHVNTVGQAVLADVFFEALLATEPSGHAKSTNTTLLD